MEPAAAPPPGPPDPAAAPPPGTAAPDAGSRSSAAPDAGPDAGPRLERGQGRSPRDMVMSLAVLLIPIALLLVFYRVVLSGDDPITVDPAPTVAQAQQAGAFPVMVPQGLSEDWHVSSATFQQKAEGATLRIGYVGPGSEPVQLVESSVPAATLLPAELGDSAKALGNFRTPAGVWRVYDARPGERALVLAEPQRTVVVVGRADIGDLQVLGAALR